MRGIWGCLESLVRRGYVRLLCLRREHVCPKEAEKYFERNKILLQKVREKRMEYLDQKNILLKLLILKCGSMSS